MERFHVFVNTPLCIWENVFVEFGGGGGCWEGSEGKYIEKGEGKGEKDLFPVSICFTSDSYQC